MKPYTPEEIARAFCLLLRLNVELAYCVGGANEDELLDAEADFLERMAQGLRERIGYATVCPPRRRD